jgi:hypothetical protein
MNGGGCSCLIKTIGRIGIPENKKVLLEFILAQRFGHFFYLAIKLKQRHYKN